MIMLYLVCGLPGSGKTRVANELAGMTGGIHLRTDEIRKQIFSDPQYTDEEKHQVYDAMLRTAGAMLRAGAVVILDATFYLEKERASAISIARKSGADYVIIEVKCDEKTIEERLGKRTGDLSDADFRVYKQVKSRWQPIRQKQNHFIVETGHGKTRQMLEEIVSK